MVLSWAVTAVQYHLTPPQAVGVRGTYGLRSGMMPPRRPTSSPPPMISLQWAGEGRRHSGERACHLAGDAPHSRGPRRAFACCSMHLDRRTCMLNCPPRPCLRPLTHTRTAAGAPQVGTPTGAAGGAAGAGPARMVASGEGDWLEGDANRECVEEALHLRGGRAFQRAPTTRPSANPSIHPTDLRVVSKALPAVQRGVVGQQLHIAGAQHPVQAQLG